MEAGALAGLGFSADAATVQLDNFLAQCQSKPGATFFAADLHEGFEQPGLLAVWNALAVIFHADQQAIILTLCRESDGAGFRAVAQGVVEQMIEHAVYLRAVQMSAR